MSGLERKLIYLSQTYFLVGINQILLVIGISISNYTSRNFKLNLNLIWWVCFSFFFLTDVTSKFLKISSFTLPFNHFLWLVISRIRIRRRITIRIRRITIRIRRRITIRIRIRLYSYIIWSKIIFSLFAFTWHISAITVSL